MDSRNICKIGRIITLIVVIRKCYEGFSIRVLFGNLACRIESLLYDRGTLIFQFRNTILTLSPLADMFYRPLMPDRVIMQYRGKFWKLVRGSQQGFAPPCVDSSIARALDLT
jgi:hypothetical protein